MLAFFYAHHPEPRVAIILLTVTVMLLLFPLTAKQAKSMIAMQRLQPEIKKLQAKYKGDRQKLNEEMMKLYKENKVNPLGGLPAAPGADAGLHRPLPGAARAPTSTSRGLGALRRTLCGSPRAGKACGSRRLPKHLDFLGMDLSDVAPTPRAGSSTRCPTSSSSAWWCSPGFLQSRQSQRNAAEAEPADGR